MRDWGFSPGRQETEGARGLPLFIGDLALGNLSSRMIRGRPGLRSNPAEVLTIFPGREVFGGALFHQLYVLTTCRQYR